MSNLKLKGILWAVISMICWSTSFPVARGLISRQMVDPVTLGVVRFLLAGLIMLACARFFTKKHPLNIAPRDWLLMTGQGLLGTALMVYLLFTAQKTVSAVNASMVEALSPLLIFIMGLISVRKFSFLQALGLFFGFGGCLMILRVVDGNGFHLSSFQFGDLLVILSSFCWALYTVWSRPTVGRIGGYLFTTWTMLIGAVWLFVAEFFQLSAVILPSSLEAWGLILYFSLFPTALGFFAWNEAQNYISLALLSLSEYFTPLFSAFFACLFLGEGLTWWQFAGALIVCGAVFIEPEINLMVLSFFRKYSAKTDGN